MPEYTLDWFQILRFRDNGYVIYGHGVWAYHIMDWAGCNFHHGRLPNSPVFKKAIDALLWIRQKVLAGEYPDHMDCVGHHAGGEYGGHPCESRIVSGLQAISYTDLGKLDGTTVTKAWAEKTFKELFKAASYEDQECERKRKSK